MARPERFTRWRTRRSRGDQISGESLTCPIDPPRGAALTMFFVNGAVLATSSRGLADYDRPQRPDHSTRASACQVGALAARIGWERSRLSHHAKRMQSRGNGPVRPRCIGSAGDGDQVDSRGRRAIVEAAAGHVDLIRHLFFEGLPKEQLAPLTEALEAIYGPCRPATGRFRPPASRTVGAMTSVRRRRHRRGTIRRVHGRDRGEAQVQATRRSLAPFAHRSPRSVFGGQGVPAADWSKRRLPKPGPTT